MSLIRIHTESEFAAMRKAGRVAALVLDSIREHVKAGISTLSLDRIVQDLTTSLGGNSSLIGFKGWKHASCISVNNEVVHGIPGERVLKDGDIVTIDTVVEVEGWNGDTARTYFVGKPSIKSLRLVAATHEALMQGIAAAKPGNTVRDIGKAIHATAVRQNPPMGVVGQLGGHGIGEDIHTAPQINNIPSPNCTPLEPGMFFTIEPMLTIGSADLRQLDDGWTYVTRDRSLAAQFEHTVGVTETGVEVFTESPLGWFAPPEIMA